jgi:hypothetical protein
LVDAANSDGNGLRDSPEVYQRMLNSIRAGAFSWVAAESLGIPAETFCRWLSRGARERRGRFRQLCQDVRQAQAYARLVAEVKVYESDPEAWLRLWPGRGKKRIAPVRRARNKRTGEVRELQAIPLPGWTKDKNGNDPNLGEFMAQSMPGREKKPITHTNLAEALGCFVQMGWIEIKPDSPLLAGGERSEIEA